MTWAQRLKRVFKIDVTVCERCGGTVKIIACIEDPTVIRRIFPERLSVSLDATPGPDGGDCRRFRAVNARPDVDERLKRHSDDQIGSESTTRPAMR
jgi:hypothetical protein